MKNSPPVYPINSQRVARTLPHLLGILSLGTLAVANDGSLPTSVGQEPQSAESGSGHGHLSTIIDAFYEQINFEQVAIHTYNEKNKITGEPSNLTGSVADNASMIGIRVGSNTDLFGKAPNNTTITFDNVINKNLDHQLNREESYDNFSNYHSIVGAVFETNTADHLFNPTNTKIIINVGGGFVGGLTPELNSEGTVDTKKSYTSSIVGLYYPGTKALMGSFNGSEININANRLSSAGDNPWENQMNIVGYSARNSHTVSSTSTVTIVSAVDVKEGDETITYSANRIVGIEGQSFGSLSGALQITANASADAIITGVYLTGTAPENASSIYGIRVQIDQAKENQILNANNSGGIKQGFYLEDAVVKGSINSIIKVTGEQVYGMQLHGESLVDTVSAGVEVRGSSKNVHGLFISKEDNSFIDNINSTIDVINTYAGTDNLASAITSDIDDFRIMSEFGAHHTSDGTHSAKGYHFYTDASGAGSSETSGAIYSNLDVRANSAYYYTTENPNGQVTKPDGRHWKSVVGIQVEAEEGTSTEEAILVFGDGASVETAIGTNNELSDNPVGDALQFDSKKLTLSTVKKQPTSATPVVSLRGDIVHTGDVYGESKLTYQNGTYHVTSDNWYVTKVALGDADGKAPSLAVGDDIVRQISKVNLSASTAGGSVNLDSVAELNFHVNSVDEHSILTINSGDNASMAGLDNVNITLGRDLMQTSDEFSVVLVSGDMIDRLNGDNFTVTLTNLDGIGDLEDFFITYDGNEYAYTSGGVTIPISTDGVATDLILGRGGINGGIPDSDPIPDPVPEPSTATLALLAVAGLVARRRRKSTAPATLSR